MGDPTLRSHRSVFERIAKTLDDTDVVRDVEKLTLSKFAEISSR